MRPPNLSFYGQLTGKFSMYIKTIKLLERIRNGEIPQTRYLCYCSSNLGGSFIKEVATFIDPKYPSYTMEIFVPDKEYPAHTDDGAYSFMIPLEYGCKITIGGATHELNPWCLYGFNDGELHSTIGGVLMVKIPPTMSF